MHLQLRDMYIHMKCSVKITCKAFCEVVFKSNLEMPSQRERMNNIQKFICHLLKHIAHWNFPHKMKGG